MVLLFELGRWGNKYSISVSISGNCKNQQILTILLDQNEQGLRLVLILSKDLVSLLIRSKICMIEGTHFQLQLIGYSAKQPGISHAPRYKFNFTRVMKIDPLLQKQLERRFEKDQRIILFTTRVKMLINIDAADWQENCSGLLILYQKKYTYGFCIISTQNLDINFDFELYSNFPNYTKYIGDLRCLIFLAPSQKHCLKIMFVMENKGELSQLKKQIDKIYNITSKSTEIDFLNQPEVQQILKKVPVDENLLVKDLTFRNAVEEKIKEYFNKTSNKKENKKSTGFKYYALGREEWKVDLEETNYLRAKFENEIIDDLTQLQKQARIRSPNK